MKYLTHFLTVMLVVSIAGLAHSQQPPGEEQKIKVEVDGLSCPFCAYGLEKKLKEIEGVTKVDISVEKGEAILTLDGKTEVDPEKLKAEVKKAGFTAREVTMIVTQ